MSQSKKSKTKNGSSNDRKKSENTRKRKRDEDSDEEKLLLVSKDVASDLKEALSEILKTKKDENTGVLSKRIDSLMKRLNDLECDVYNDSDVEVETGKLDPPQKRSTVTTAQHRLAMSQEKGAIEAKRSLVQDFHERYLGIVESLYFRKMRRKGKVLERDGTSNTAPIAYPLPEAGFLTSHLRPSNAMERWAPLEIAQFEAALRLWGKKFSRISDLIPSKTTREVIEFYYTWKKTSHYKEWKGSFQPLLL